jgi:WD40 repeat protein
MLQSARLLCRILTPHAPSPSSPLPTGTVKNGIILLPDNRSMIYALGSTIVKRDVINSHDQQFLQGHSDRVTCMSLSPSGRYLASGQVTYLGFQADIIVWDLETLEIVHRLRLHKVISFRPLALGISVAKNLDFGNMRSGHCQQKLVDAKPQTQNRRCVWRILPSLATTSGWHQSEGRMTTLLWSGTWRRARLFAG